MSMVGTIQCHNSIPFLICKYSETMNFSGASGEEIGPGSKSIQTADVFLKRRSIDTAERLLYHLLGYFIQKRERRRRF